MKLRYDQRDNLNPLVAVVLSPRGTFATCMIASELKQACCYASIYIEMHAMTNIAVDLMPTPSREQRLVKGTRQCASALQH